jgi:hypothetical protein
MLVTLTDTQKQCLLKYVDDKTYTQRWGFALGVLSAIAGVGCLLTVSDVEVKADALYLAVIGAVIVGATVRDVIRFRHVRDYLNEENYLVSKRTVSADHVAETTQTTDYSRSLKDSYAYYDNEPPKNSRISIKKYYLLDGYNVKYECIKYLDYRKCMELGEFIAVDFPTGEKFALC